MMARGGNPDLNWQEDAIIAESMFALPSRSPIVENKVRAFLSSRFPEAAVEKFVDSLGLSLGVYVSCTAERGGEREPLRRKFLTVAKHARGLSDAISALDADE